MREACSGTQEKVMWQDLMWKMVACCYTPIVNFLLTWRCKHFENGISLAKPVWYVVQMDSWGHLRLHATRYYLSSSAQSICNHYYSYYDSTCPLLQEPRSFSCLQVLGTCCSQRNGNLPSSVTCCTWTEYETLKTPDSARCRHSSMGRSLSCQHK